MAKRTMQLQTDLQTDEDVDTFLKNKGLLVIDIYSEWCGPCLGIVSTLMRLKLNIGDNLNFAIAKSDTISYFNRFNKKSEPVWLFIVDGRAVNIMFGTDAPKLARLVTDEMKLITKASMRENYAITEPQPEEVKRASIQNEVKTAKIMKETQEIQRKKFSYFKYVTDTIEENLPDIGVSIIGPHIHRDNFRKIIDFGNEKFAIQCKDRKNQPITKEQFEIINTVCKNPLPPDVIDAMDGKDLFICFWKILDSGVKRKVPEVLEAFAEEIVKPKVIPADEYQEVETIQPPLISSIKIKTQYELPEDVECPHDVESEPEPDHDPRKDRKPHSDAHNEEYETNYSENASEMGSEEYEEIEDPKQQNMLDIVFDDFSIDQPIEEEEVHIDEQPKKNICTKTVTIPGIWVPKDERTHAALIYVLFRMQTASFLPPDPVPEPPHLIMAFNTYKQRDLIAFAERYKDDVPAYGYFTSDDADEAEFIANSNQKYANRTQAATDKLVFKVNKRTSHTMLSLVTYGPTYVSFNTQIGQVEARKFFPEGYVTAEEEMRQLAEEANIQNTSKKAKKKEPQTSLSAGKGSKLKPSTHSTGDATTEEAVVEPQPQGPAAHPPEETGDHDADQTAEHKAENVNEEKSEIGEEKTGEIGGAVETGETPVAEPVPTGEVPENVDAIPPSNEPPANEPTANESPAVETPADALGANEIPDNEPPANEPPANEPPASEPPANEPPANEPPANEPPANEPPASEPPANQPPTNEPPTNQPPVIETPA